MEGKICTHHKFGYCKYNKDCKKKHVKGECKDLATCKNITNCMKRHPKCCIKYASGKCRYETDCSYKHQEPAEIKEHNQLSDKVKQLEKVVHALTCKVLSLEEEVTEIRDNNKNNEEKVILALKDREKAFEDEDNTTNINFKPKISSSPKYKKTSSQSQIKKDKVKKK